jgi:virginiamycin B lyase
MKGDEGALFRTLRRRETIMFATRRAATPLEQARRQQTSPTFLVLALLALSSLLVLLSACGTPGTTSAVTAPVAQAQTVRQVRVHLAPAPTISKTVRPAQRHLYPFSTIDVGLMQPAVDAQDNVWVGEMNTNRLGRLNTQTGVVTSWIPPGAEYGIMTTTIDAHGDVWFAEQNANYIGRFDPWQQTFRLFPLGTWHGIPLGPQDLHFDSRGLLWFTAEAAGAIGRLDPGTGAVHLWPVPSPAPRIPSSPYGLTVTPNGQVWFSDFAGGAIGTLDPATGQVILYDLPNPQAQVFSIATDTTGRIWFTEVLPGKLGMFDPTTGTLTELPVPAISKYPPALYELVIDHEENIWFVDVGSDTLVRYAPGKDSLTFFQLSLPSSAPFGLTLDPAGKLWFTAGGSTADYVGEMA